MTKVERRALDGEALRLCLAEEKRQEAQAQRGVTKAMAALPPPYGRVAHDDGGQTLPSEDDVEPTKAHLAGRTGKTRERRLDLGAQSLPGAEVATLRREENESQRNQRQGADRCRSRRLAHDEGEGEAKAPRIRRRWSPVG